MTPTQKLVFDALHGPRTPAQVADACGLSTETARKALNELLDLGLVSALRGGR